MNAAESPNLRLRYCEDIDGLRAVAVLLVVFNHVDIKRFHGGLLRSDWHVEAAAAYVVAGCGGAIYLVFPLLLMAIGRQARVMTTALPDGC